MSKKWITTAVVAVLLLTGAGTQAQAQASPAAKPAAASNDVSAMGCATLKNTWKDFPTGIWYAQVYNPCGIAKSMRATVPIFPDPDCKMVGPYTSAVFRTWNQADGAADC